MAATRIEPPRSGALPEKRRYTQREQRNDQKEKNNVYVHVQIAQVLIGRSRCCRATARKVCGKTSSSSYNLNPFAKNEPRFCTPIRRSSYLSNKSTHGAQVIKPQEIEHHNSLPRVTFSKVYPILRRAHNIGAGVWFRFSKKKNGALKSNKHEKISRKQQQQQQQLRLRRRTGQR